MKKLLLGPPLLPSPITKVGQAGSRGVRAGWTERGLVAATGFPSGDHEEAWVGAGSPLSLVFGNQCCLSPPPNSSHPGKQGRKRWNKGSVVEDMGVETQGSDRCLLLLWGWGIGLCVQWGGVQGYIA